MVSLNQYYQQRERDNLFSGKRRILVQVSCSGYGQQAREKTQR